jgi:organic hydroperoxide reductase OsmC/OhrA
VELRPSLVTEGDPALVRDISAKAEKFCLIARAVEGNVRKVVRPIEVRRKANALQSAIS